MCVHLRRVSRNADAEVVGMCVQKCSNAQIETSKMEYLYSQYVLFKLSVNLVLINGGFISNSVVIPWFPSHSNPMIY